MFLAIGNQILKDGRIYLHGMPDLVVWDVVKHKVVLYLIVTIKIFNYLLEFVQIVHVCRSERA